MITNIKTSMILLLYLMIAEGRLSHQTQISQV